MKETNILKLITLVLISLFTIRLVYSAILHPLYMGWDPGLHLNAAQLILQGKIPYVDMMDVNPPLVWYIDMIPALWANMFHIPAPQAFTLFLALVILYSASSCYFLFFYCAENKKATDTATYIAFIVALIYFNFLLRFDFGQRETIFVLFYIPFFVLRWLCWNGYAPKQKWISVLIGIVGGMGICLKPYFLIPALAVEIYFLLNKNIFDLKTYKNFISPDALGALAAACSYALHFLLMPQAMRDNYFGFVVPAFMLGYNYWDTSLGGSFCPPDKRMVFWLMVLACTLAMSLRRKSSLIEPLIVFGVTSNIPYLLQFKGWAYHDQPVLAASLILTFILISYLIVHLGYKISACCAIPPTILVWIVPVAIGGYLAFDAFQDMQAVKQDTKIDMSFIGYEGLSPRSDISCPFFDVFQKEWNRKDKVIFISNGVTPEYPFLTQINAAPGSRHLHCVILSVLQYIKDMHEKTPKNVALFTQEERIVKEYIQDIESNKPKLVFVQIGPVLDYLKPYGFVEKLQASYDKIESHDNFDVYKLRNEGS